MEITLASTYEQVDGAIKNVMAYAACGLGLSNGRFLFELDFVMRELLNNAVEHGNGGNPDKMIVFEIKTEDAILQVCVVDEGACFDGQALAKILRQAGPVRAAMLPEGLA